MTFSAPVPPRRRVPGGGFRAKRCSVSPQQRTCPADASRAAVFRQSAVPFRRSSAPALRTRPGRQFSDKALFRFAAAAFPPRRRVPGGSFQTKRCSVSPQQRSRPADASRSAGFPAVQNGSPASFIVLLPRVIPRKPLHPRFPAPAARPGGCPPATPTLTGGISTKWQTNVSPPPAPCRGRSPNPFLKTDT